MRIDVRASFSSMTPFQIIEYDIPYSNLVWNRRYYDYGEFQIQIDPDLYDPDSWTFITTPDSDEMGLIQKVEYTSENGGRLVLSGMFAESLLDNAVLLGANYGVYAQSTVDWCEKLFEAFYVPDTVSLRFPISLSKASISGGVGGFLEIDVGKGLGSRIMAYLNNLSASYSVKANSSETGGVFHIWRGLDRSASQGDRAPVIFNSYCGDIYDISIVRDESPVKNIAIVEYENTNGGKTTIRVPSTDPFIPAAAGYYKEVFVSSSGFDSSATDEQRAQQARQDGMEALYEAKPVMDVDATVYDPSGLRRDYDLGDVVTLQIPEVGITDNTRIVETTEIFNSEGKTIELGFGNKRISLMERAIKTWLYL